MAKKPKTGDGVLATGPANYRALPYPKDFDFDKSPYDFDQIMDAAIAAHEANRAYCQSIGDDSQLSWADCPEWQANSAIDGVAFAIKNNFPSPWHMHNNWLEQKVKDGWVYGEVKDAIAKTHPCIVSYDALPEAQRKKDDIFRDTIMKVLDISVDQLTVEAKAPTAEAKAMASMLECAAAMTGLLELDDDWNWPEIAMCLADFYRNEPTTSAAAGLMQLKLKLKIVLMPDEDPRRVELILDLFRLAITRMVEIGTADAKAEAAKLQAQNFKPAHDRLEKGEGIYDKDPGRFEKSDLGKSLDQQAKLNPDG